MKLVRFEKDGAVAMGLLREDGSVHPTYGTSLAELMGRPLPRDDGGPGVVPDRLLAPVPRPGKILCAGVNYLSHKAENPDAVIPSSPFFFSKLPTAVVGPGEAIVLPDRSSQVDYEVELAVVIGRRSKRLRAESALDAVYGYTVVNDVSARDVQFRDNQITLGKGFDSFCPLGPCVLTADEVPDPQQLRVRSFVNGEMRQSASTGDMVFSVAQLLEEVSAQITLEAGDVVTTGTPAGVGTFRHPPVYLSPGDEVIVEVDAIGRLANPVIAGW